MKIKPNFLNEGWWIEFDSDPDIDGTPILADILGEDDSICIARVFEIDEFDYDRALLMVAAPTMKSALIKALLYCGHLERICATYCVPDGDDSEAFNAILGTVDAPEGREVMLEIMNALDHTVIVSVSQ